MNRSALLAVLLALPGCEGKKVAPAFQRPPAPVVAAVATAADVPVYLDEIGRCAARELVSLQPQVTGRITQIHFADGADVKAGDLLFTVDPRPFQAQLAAAEAALAQAKASLDLSKVESARVAGLVEKKAAAQQEVDAARNAVAVGEARVRQNQALVETARLDVEYTSVRSPIQGRAGRRLVDVGNTVTANLTALLTIQRLDPIYVDFTVTEGGLPAVQRSLARGAPRVEVRLPDEPGPPLEGGLTFVDSAVQEGTGTVMLRATLPNPERRLWPGRFVKARLVLDVAKGAVLVPAAAPQVSAKGPFVYVVTPEGTAELRPVTLGQRHDDRVVVASGLRAGERVVKEGHMGVMPGGPVRVQEPPGAGKEPGK